LSAHNLYLPRDQNCAAQLLWSISYPSFTQLPLSIRTTWCRSLTAPLAAKAAGSVLIRGPRRIRPAPGESSFDRRPDQVAILRPTAVVVLEVFQAEQILEHEPGMAGA